VNDGYSLLEVLTSDGGGSMDGLCAISRCPTEREIVDDGMLHTARSFSKIIHDESGVEYGTMLEY
jgi:hypothetical protein